MIACFACAAVSMHAQQGASAAAEAALVRMEAAYRSLESLHVRVRWSARFTGGMSAEDFPLPGPESLELRMQRPNKLFLSATSKRPEGQSSYLVVSDGTTLTSWKSWTNTFTQTKAPAAVAGIGRLLPDDTIGAFVDGTWEAENIAEWDLLADDRGLSVAQALASSGGLLAMTGPEKLGDAQVNVVRITAGGGAVPFTLEQRLSLDAESFLLRGLAMSARGKHPDSGRDFTVEMRGEYTLHTTKPTFSDADFRFEAPRGARPAPAR